jgi:hypothetical protein
VTHNINLEGPRLQALRERKTYEDRGIADLYDEVVVVKETVSRLAKSVDSISEALAVLTDQMADTNDWRRDVNEVFNRFDWVNVDA